ncbi:hypothetical protein QR680_009438 [Steinernema hermaphroditum]|uniref:KATNIP domain-containing protein n=1 Tax=Steinernema hermaphroditum TaxID=289476 RepID=A0AA39M9E4_9BILA|nr:hypothetical protein QR680_009438 [Steinernema hermaphroditum]
MDAEADSSSNGFQMDCTIPELPAGQKLRLFLVKPWDDPNFVGLNTVEIFSSKGTRAEIASITTNAAESQGSVESLLCGNGFRCTDPKEMWLAKYSATEGPVWVEIVFAEPTELAMIRIWNYNESRVHALRGVHEMRIELDDVVVFFGEMSCAYSEQVVQPLGDTILFTTSDAILEAVSENDAFLQEAGEITRTTSLLDLLHIDVSTPSPLDTNALFNLPASASLGGIVHRPTTGDLRRRASLSELLLAEFGSASTSDAPSEASEDEGAVAGRVFHMEITANWGAPDVVGLTGVQFLGPHGTLLDNSKCSVKASNGDDAVKRILDGQNLTTKADEMWLCKFDPEGPPLCLTFTFTETVSVTGISVWNYNESPEMAYAGVRCAQFYFGSRTLSSVLLRKAPGYVFFDFVQDVLFDKVQLLRPSTARPNTRSINAFIYQIRLLSSWGDEFYIGLNGIEIFDRHNQLISLKPQNIAAFPESVNVLPNVVGDPRSSDKLIDGVNDTTKPAHMWLTPIFPNKYARIFIIFDMPTFVSQICVYNYRKNPERGVRHIAISADDLIVFSGEVPQSTTGQTGKLAISLRE